MRWAWKCHKAWARQAGDNASSKKKAKCQTVSLKTSVPADLCVNLAQPRVIREEMHP